MPEVYNKALNKFTEKYGENVYPCTSTEEFNKLKRRGVNVALVDENDYHYITHSSYYNPPIENENNSLSDELKSWFEECKSYLPKDLITWGDNLVEGIVNEFN